MIGSFWNLCRACPSMPVDKQLHSEYRSTYRWHEFTGNSRPEVVRRAPAPNPSQFIGPTNEPPLPRRKKCPELAYKSHEFIIGSEYTDARGGHGGANRLARSEERGGTPSRRSKSEGPPAVPNGRAYAIPEEVDGTAKKQAGESNGLLKKTISKLSTEYRLQFVWPNVRRIKGIEASDAADHPRKSISMGVLKASQQQQHQQQQQQLHLRQNQQHHQTMAAMPTVHKKRTTNQKEATLHELEPLVSDVEESKPPEKQVTIVEKVERKMTIRPFSQAFDQERVNHFITKKENFGFEAAKDEVDNKQPSSSQQEETVLLNGSAPPRSQPNLDLWFKEVVELRKKAGEYKSRGWGIEIDPELYKKQRDLWDQVSKRSSLSALSLASSVHKPITKEEKEQENTKKSTPVSKATTKSRVPGHALSLDNKDEMSALPARFSNIRHHLERTTGPDVEEGALLPSPTREKLMPAITKRESESQRGSPKKTAASRHGSPQKGSPQKGSPKKVLKLRSQSVGPAVIENVSPKRQIRSASTAPSARLTAHKRTPTAAHAAHAGTIGSGTTTAERKTRPSTLSTTLHSRSKSSSLPHSGRAQTVPANATTTTTTTATTTAATTASAHQPHHTSHHHASQSSQHSNQTNLSRKLPHQPATPQMRKKDKDKSNLMSVGAGTNARMTRSPRPKSTIAATTVGAVGSAGGSAGKVATSAATRPCSAAPTVTAPATTKPPQTAATTNTTAGPATIGSTIPAVITTSQVPVIAPTAAVLSATAQAKQPTVAAPATNPAAAAITTPAKMPTAAPAPVGPPTPVRASMMKQTDPMMMSVFGELPSSVSGGSVGNVGVGIGVGSGGGGGGVSDVGGNVGAGAGTSAAHVEPQAARNLTLTGLTVPYSYRDNKLAENDGEDGRDTAISVSSCSPQPVAEIPDEPIVKSPPEPTRVKSPEQILMRSPDPVNWTVPLDTGKTFTVTQNVKEGENYSRPQSEIKASTPVEKPPPPPQSAPPQLTEQSKMDAWKRADLCDPKLDAAAMAIAAATATAAAAGKTSSAAVVATQPMVGAGGLPSPPPPPPSARAGLYEAKPVPGSTLRCLDDPIFDVDIAHLAAAASGGGVGGGNTPSSSTSTTTNTAVTARTTATDVLEKARDRFDRFWGGSKEEQV